MEQRQELLKRIYYDINSTGSFGGAKRLFDKVKAIDPSINLKQVRDWLKGQETYTNFKSRRIHFHRLPILVDRVDEQWQADLMDMSYWSQYNDQNRYILVVIDVLSRFAFAEPLRDKSARSIIAAFTKVFSSGRKPEKIQTDQGKEFKNKWFAKFCRDQGIHYFYTTDNTIKCALAERFIRTLRARIYRFIYWKHTQRYIDDLKTIIDNYNNSYHRTIKRAPISVTLENQQQVVQTIQASIKDDPKRKQKYNENQHVKIPLNDSSEKEAAQKWTDEVFKISSVKETPQKFVYKLKDLAGEPISSIFYPEELQTVNYDPDARFSFKNIDKKI